MLGIVVQYFKAGTKNMNDKRSYDTFFFDLDGTLTDSSLGITNSVIYALKKYGIEETDRTKLYPFIGPPLTVSSRNIMVFQRSSVRKRSDSTENITRRRASSRTGFTTDLRRCWGS